ncbi:MAG: outer membrane beta-barrel protein [Saprospiraceae bacterium]|nr:outer membrane beta-barrel protein [Saprospiraceae bacterium]
MKNCLFIILLIAHWNLAAQSKEKDRLNWGIFSGVEHHSVGLEDLAGMDPESPRAGSGDVSTGFTGGFFLNKSIFPWLEIQPELGISVVRQNFQFKPDGPKSFRFYDLELPIHFRVVDTRKKHAPLRACILAGPRVSWNLAGNSKEYLSINQERIAVDLGLGMEIKLKQWRIQPAFIYSHGLNDLHFPAQGKYDDVAGRIVRDKLSLKILCRKVHK